MSSGTNDAGSVGSINRVVECECFDRASSSSSLNCEECESVAAIDTLLCTPMIDIPSGDISNGPMDDAKDQRRDPGMR